MPVDLNAIMSWLQTQTASPRQPGFWLLWSLGIAILAANLSWLAQRVGPVRRRVTEPILQWHGTAPLIWLAAALFFLLPPFAAWRTGAISPAALGLAELDWLNGLGAGGLLGTAIIAVTLIAWASYRDAVATIPESAARRWLRPVDAGLQQWRLAFYRAVGGGLLAAMGTASLVEPAQIATLAEGPLAFLAEPAGALLAWWVKSGPTADPVYWSAWLGLALAGLEWLLNPHVRAALRMPGNLETPVRTAALAAATTGLFILTRNFWLCLGCHVLIEVAVAATAQTQPGDKENAFLARLRRPKNA